MTINEKLIDQNEIIIEKNLLFVLNNEEKIASVVGNESAEGDIIIPRSIKYKKQEYLITCIMKDAFESSDIINSIRFPNDSEIRIIERAAFANSSIKSLTIPSSITELKEGWLLGTHDLEQIQIVENKKSKNICFEGNFIVGKSDQKSDIFDVLIFARRDIKLALIPSKIKKIASYAFAYSKIESITISHHINEISEGTFFFCHKLRNIQIPRKSKLKTISKAAFSSHNIESITIPSSIEKFGDGWCNQTVGLKSIKIKKNSQQNISYFEKKFIIRKTDIKSDTFDSIIFACRDIRFCSIPSFIKRIDSCAFTYSKIEYITISPHLTEICDNAFSLCRNLRGIKIPDNSELHKIGKSAFCWTSIESFTISHHITEICEKTFYFCKNLREVKFPKNSNLKIIGRDAFSWSSIESIKIPLHVTQICDCAFLGCNKLQNVEIPYYSELSFIGKLAFSETLISNMVIPPGVNHIGENAFSECKDLQIIEINENYELECNGKNIFENCKKAILMISKKPNNIIS